LLQILKQVTGGPVVFAYGVVAVQAAADARTETARRALRAVLWNPPLTPAEWPLAVLLIPPLTLDRSMQIVEEDHQAPDHTVIAETAYLKAFFARVLPI
jgi:hypothetical protein